MHSTASDGAVAPADVVAAAQRAGLSAIALTDHDTVDGVADAQHAGELLGVRVIAGVELSAVDDGDEIHVLGLHLSHPEHIASALDELKETRRERARTTVERLNALGIPVTIEAVFAAAGDGAVGRPHVAKALVAGGWARDFRDAFDRWLGTGKPACVEKRTVTFEEAARLIHEAGGISVYAHPGGDGLARFTRRSSRRSGSMRLKCSTRAIRRMRSCDSRRSPTSLASCRAAVPIGMALRRVIVRSGV